MSSQDHIQVRASLIMLKDRAALIYVLKSDLVGLSYGMRYQQHQTPSVCSEKRNQPFYKWIFCYFHNVLKSLTSEVDGTELSQQGTEGYGVL